VDVSQQAGTGSAVARAAAAAGVPAETASAIVQENSDARLAGLRSALSVLAVIALLALFPGRRLPTRQPGAAPSEPEETEEP
jgi:hypothetical protein